MTPIVRGRPASIHSTQGRFAKALTIYTFNVNCESQQSSSPKTHIHKQRQIQSASETQCMLYLSKAGGSRIWNIILAVFLWWQRQRQDFMHYWGWIFFRGQYFPGVNIFQEWIFFRSEYFSVFQEWIFFRGDYFSGVTIFLGWIFLGVDKEYFSWVNIFQGN